MEVGSNSIPLQPRRICLCRIENLIPGGDVLHSRLHVSGQFPYYSVVFVSGIRSAAAQGLGYLLWQLGHLEDGRKARERDQGGGELEVSRFLTNLQMTLSYLKIMDLSLATFHYLTFAPTCPRARGGGCSQPAFY